MILFKLIFLVSIITSTACVRSSGDSDTQNSDNAGSQSTSDTSVVSVADQSFSLAEDLMPGSLVGKIETTNSGDRELQFTLSGDDASFFEVRDDGEIYLREYVNFEFRSSLQITAAVVDGDNTVSFSLSFEVSDVSEPVIEGVFISGTAWNSIVSDYGDGGVADDGLARGYALPANINNTRVLPWSGLNTIVVKFSEDVGASLSVSDFDLSSSVPGTKADSNPGAIPTISNVSWDGANNEATLSLSQAIEPSVVNLAINTKGIYTSSGQTLEKISAYRSEDSSSTVYTIDFPVLPGDFDGDKTVDASDQSDVTGLNSANITDPGSGDLQLNSGYDVFADMNGDTFVFASDVSVVIGAIGSSVP